MKSSYLFYVLTGCLFLAALPQLGAADLPAGWTTDWEAATARAASEEKPMFAVFSATWCGPCQAMVKGIYPQQEVRAALESWVPIYIDVDKHEELAQRYGVSSLPTMVYLNADQSEINRTVGAISKVEKMVDLLKTKGGAKYEGGSRSPLVARQLKTLTMQIEAAPEDPELRIQRLDLVLNEVLDSLSLENLELAGEDLQAIGRLDRAAYTELVESRRLHAVLRAIQAQPELEEHYLRQFMQQFPQGERTSKLHAFAARATMKRARYADTVRHMKAYLQRFPKGGYVDEFNLLLPQMEDFLKLTKGVSFD